MLPHLTSEPPAPQETRENRTKPPPAFARKAIWIAWLLAIATLLVVSFRSRPGSSPSVIARGDALAIARSYVDHQWIPTEANAYHGLDSKGIRVDTPDAAVPGTHGERGWWIAGQRNIGIPYQWGGFSTPEEFDRGLRDGKYAGDVYSAEKRRLLDAGVSGFAVGVDCSGFVSRCWRLPRSYSTRELPQLCLPVKDLTQLRAGDIFNKHNAHVQLFAEWADQAQARVRVYEAKSRVQITELPLQQIIDEGYSAWRYRGMRD